MYKLQLRLMVAFLFLIVHLAYGQHESYRMFAFSAGFSGLARQDLIYSQLVHSSISAHAYSLRYIRSKKWLHFADVGFAYNTAQPVTGTAADVGEHGHMIMPHEFLLLRLNYAIGRPLKKNSLSIDYGGVAFATDVQAAFYRFGLSDMFGYFISQSANAWYRKDLRLTERHRLIFQTDIPLLSWVARPPYLAEDDEFIENISSHKGSKIILAFVEDGRLATWNRLQRVDLHIEYLFSVSRKVQLGGGYRFGFIRSSIPRSLISYHHQLSVSAGLKF